MNQRDLEVKARDYYEMNRYKCIRATPVAYTNSEGKTRVTQNDFFGEADLICFNLDQRDTIFVQVTMSEEVFKRHKESCLNNFHLPYRFHQILFYKDEKGRWDFRREYLNHKFHRFFADTSVKSPMIAVREWLKKKKAEKTKHL